MGLLDTESTTSSAVAMNRSAFFCPHAPDYIWELNDTVFAWILDSVTSIACPTTILLITLVTIAVNQRKELKKT